MSVPCWGRGTLFTSCVLRWHCAEPPGCSCPCWCHTWEMLSAKSQPWCSEFLPECGPPNCSRSLLATKYSSHLAISSAFSLTPVLSSRLAPHAVLSSCSVSAWPFLFSLWISPLQHLCYPGGTQGVHSPEALTAFSWGVPGRQTADKALQNLGGKECCSV